MKKFISVMLVVLVMFSIATVAASAQCVPANDYQISGQAIVRTSDSSSINYRIRLFIVQRMVEKTNNRIQKLVDRAIADENADLDKLVKKTNALALRTIRVAEILGIEVVCEYKAYEIHGVTVYIDPLIVIKR